MPIKGRKRNREKRVLQDHDINYFICGNTYVYVLSNYYKRSSYAQDHMLNLYDLRHVLYNFLRGVLKGMVNTNSGQNSTEVANVNVLFDNAGRFGLIWA